MAQFITRIELHEATEAHYLKLHDAMALEGFVRYVDGFDDVGRPHRYELPPAEYNCERSYTLLQVFEAATRAANSTGCSSWILVSEITNWRGQMRLLT